MTEPQHFRLCSTCKSPIAFLTQYYVCSVSTCNRKATALYFCSVPCWDAHVPEARHRDAWAEQATAPSREAWLQERSAQASSGGRRIVSGGRPAPETPSPVDEDDAELPREVLVVVSKLKSYVRAHSSMNTAGGVVEVLSDHLRTLCKKAARSAAANSRKTILARDFEAVLEGRSAADD